MRMDGFPSMIVKSQVFELSQTGIRDENGQFVIMIVKSMDFEPFQIESGMRMDSFRV